VYLKILIGACSKLRVQERKEICVTEREDMSMEMKLTLKGKGCRGTLEEFNITTALFVLICISPVYVNKKLKSTLAVRMFCFPYDWIL
jgi:hypothetical protein